MPKTGALWVEVHQSAGQPETKLYGDAWGRTVAKAQRGFDGGWVNVYINYDAQGRPIFESAPNSSLGTTSSYDALGRVTQVTNALGHTSSIEIGSNYTRSINAKGQDSYEYSNGFGETVRTVDNLGGEVLFQYDAAGQLVQTTVQASGGSLNSVYVGYDNWGNKIAMTDPVKGTWSYTYNAFGELIAQQSAHGDEQAILYDSLGRKVRSYQPGVGTRCWYYGTDANAHNLGRLQRVALHRDVTVDCSTTRQSEHEQLYSYDSAGRIVQQLTRIDGTPYLESYSYDSHGRLATTTYPTGNTAVSVRRDYNSFGYFEQLVRVETNEVLKSISATNQQGQVTSISYVGGQQASRSYNILGWLTYTSMLNSLSEWNAVSLSHDALGNVTSRDTSFERPNGASTLVDESFSYDGLNRLRFTYQNFTDTNMGITNSTSSTVEQRYDGYGNITYRTGVGDYNYLTDGSMRLSSITTPVDDDDPIIDPPPGPCCVGAFSFEPIPIDGPGLEPGDGPDVLWKFRYDASGNVKSDGTRTFTYDGADRVTSISKAGNSSSMHYDASGNLYYQHDQLSEGNQSVSYTKHIIGGFEKKTRSGGAGYLVEYRYTVADDVVIVQRDSANTSHEATYLLFKDHLGSVFTTLASTGQIISQQIFSAFGETRSIHMSSAMSLGLMMAPTEQGFTGHRQMDALGVIHMKGRIYDPTIGRFLQADPFIQAPKNSQNYNRYSYVLNNPMSYTDPSGYFFKAVFNTIKKYWRQITSIAVMFIPGVNVMLMGAISGYISSGSLQGALIGAFTVGMSGVPAGDLGGFLVQGVVGGLASKMSGGKFSHGFISAGISSLAGGQIGKINDTAGRVVARAVIGGTVSKLTGGKFGNGAFSAAFSQALAETIANRPAPEMSDLDATSAQMSDAMYGAKGGDIATLSIDGYTLQDIDTTGGLYAGIWVNDDGHHIIAYRGTATLSDWGDNIRQAFGYNSSRYDAAMELAGNYHDTTNGNIHFTGHSLGGGLAAASAIATGGSATIFNAAGLHANTLRGYSPGAASITHYRSSTDILRLGNALTPTTLYGKKVSLGPAGWHTMSHACRRATGTC